MPSSWWHWSMDKKQRSKLFELADVSPVKKVTKHRCTLRSEIKRKVESTHNIMKKNASASLFKQTNRKVVFCLWSFKKYIR